MWGVINYPKTTVTLFPVKRRVSITTALPIPLRILVPVTLTRSATTQTTGHGHQDARAASGSLTFYNGELSSQFVPGGTVFTGNDGQKVITDAAGTIPAGNPPSYGAASIAAHTVSTGQVTNIATEDIQVALSSDLLVKNLAPFTGGRDARDYRAVAQSDLQGITTSTTQFLNQQIPQAFSLRLGEALHTTTCTTKITADHAPGDEAQSVTVTTSQTCAAVAYNSQELDTKATVAYTVKARPATQYQLLGSVHTSVISITPFTVTVWGRWAYIITASYEQSLAEQIAGDTPAQAKAHLLKTGVISQATIPNTLPQAMSITFVVLMEV